MNAISARRPRVSPGSTRPSTATSRRDVVVRLETPDELFAVDTHSLFADGGRRVSGMQELVEQFMSRKKVHPGERIVLELPSAVGKAERAEPPVDFQMAIRRYCACRVEDARRERAVMWRQGRQSLLSGGVLFCIGVLLSFAFTRPGMPEFWQELLGNGVFLVVAWVGLWYPLDLLFITRQPLKREMRTLIAMSALPVVVRAPIEPDPSPPVHRGATRLSPHGETVELESPSGQGRG
jgi:hypothetical protein